MLKDLVGSYGFELTEQFIGYQFKEDFESKDYDPKWVLGKDKNWLKQSDVVISDFTSYSIGTDFELVLSKEVFNKKVYAVVPPERRFHPWLKFYCNHFYDSVSQALDQIKIDFPDGPKPIPVDKRQYDAIAGEYRLVEETQSQKYVYDFNLRKQLESIDLKDKKVVVLHCASGYRARIVKEMGASDVLGIDLSYQEIRIAEDIEAHNSQGIHYIIEDVYTQDFIENIPKRFVGSTDIVVGYFALDHASTKKELDNITENISKLLKVGGTFLGMIDSPKSEESLPNKYGVVLSFDEKNTNRGEGEPRRVSIYKDGKEVTHFHNFVWGLDSLSSSLSNFGLEDIEINDALVSEKGKEENDPGFWNEYEAHPDQMVVSAKKG
jgi:SAM-dependent methyltransferase